MTESGSVAASGEALRTATASMRCLGVRVGPGAAG